MRTRREDSLRRPQVRAGIRDHSSPSRARYPRAEVAPAASGKPPPSLRDSQRPWRPNARSSGGRSRHAESVIMQAATGTDALRPHPPTLPPDPTPPRPCDPSPTDLHFPTTRLPSDVNARGGSPPHPTSSPTPPFAAAGQGQGSALARGARVGRGCQWCEERLKKDPPTHPPNTNPYQDSLSAQMSKLQTANGGEPQQVFSGPHHGGPPSPAHTPLLTKHSSPWYRHAATHTPPRPTLQHFPLLNGTDDAEIAFKAVEDTEAVYRGVKATTSKIVTSCHRHHHGCYQNNTDAAATPFKGRL